MLFFSTSLLIPAEDMAQALQEQPCDQADHCGGRL